MVATILMGCIFATFCLFVLAIAASDFQTGPSAKLKARCAELEKYNLDNDETIEKLRTENNELKAENFALRNDMPYPTIEQDEHEKKAILETLEKELRKINGS